MWTSLALIFLAGLSMATLCRRLRLPRIIWPPASTLGPVP